MIREPRPKGKAGASLEQTREEGPAGNGEGRGPEAEASLKGFRGTVANWGMLLLMSSE